MYGHAPFHMNDIHVERVGIWANNMGINNDDIANTCEYKWTCKGQFWDGEVGTCRREMGKVGQGENGKGKGKVRGWKCYQVENKDPISSNEICLIMCEILFMDEVVYRWQLFATECDHINEIKFWMDFFV